ncbi:MAG TPA: thioesterase family protein [Chloroflexota bacterium]|nr:thioesterase family protein [Chloroflexota bacterium]
MRVRTNQTDLNGAMYHGAYLDCFEAARVDVFRRLGYSYARTLAEGFVPVIRRIECEYLHPAFMDQEIVVVVIALGQAVFAFLDRSGKPLRVPRDLRICVEENMLLNPR